MEDDGGVLMTQGNYSGERGEFDEYIDPTGKSITSEIATASQASSGDAYAVPSSRDVAAINTALSTNDVVILEPGATYTNAGNTITFPSDREATVMAHGATIEATSNPTVFMPEASVTGGWSAWLGGVFEGTQSAGDVGFVVEDSIKNIIEPHHGEDMECFIALLNDDLWCEMNKIRTFGKDNETDVMLVGGNGSPPAGSSVQRSTVGGAGSSRSFRFLQLELMSSVRTDVATNGTQTNGAYGVYMDDASPYAGHLKMSIAAGSEITAWRYNNRMNGNWVQFHAETPGTRTGGTGIEVTENIRQPAFLQTRIGGSIGTAVDNQTTKPLFSYDTELSGSGGAQFGIRWLVDGSSVASWNTSDSPNYTQSFGTDYTVRYQNAGSATNPTIKLGGSNTAGFYVDSNGDIVAVDEAGNTAVLT